MAQRIPRRIEQLQGVPAPSGTVPQLLCRRSDGTYLWMTISEVLADIMAVAPVGGQSLYINTSGIVVPGGVGYPTGSEAATGKGQATAIGEQSGVAAASGSEAATGKGTAAAQGTSTGGGTANATGTGAAVEAGQAQPDVSKTVDLWQDFEFDTVNTSNLALQDHCNEGTWTLSNAAGRLLTGTGGQKLSPQKFSPGGDAGTRGFGYSNPGTTGSPGYAQYTFAGTKSNGLSFGFWLKAPSGVIGTWSEHDIIALYIRNSAADCYVKMGDLQTGNSIRLYLHNSTAYSTGYVTIPADTWVWVACQWLPNSATGWRMSVYDVNNNQIGSTVVHQTATPNQALDYLLAGSFIGASASGQSGTIWFDNLVMDWTNRVHPIGITQAAAAGAEAATGKGTAQAQGGAGASATGTGASTGAGTAVAQGVSNASPAATGTAATGTGGTATADGGAAANFDVSDFEGSADGWSFNYGGGANHGASGPITAQQHSGTYSCFVAGSWDDEVEGPWYDGYMYKTLTLRAGDITLWSKGDNAGSKIKVVIDGTTVLAFTVAGASWTQHTIAITQTGSKEVRIYGNGSDTGQIFADYISIPIA